MRFVPHAEPEQAALGTRPKSVRSRARSHLVGIDPLGITCAMICKCLISQTLQLVLGSGKRLVPLFFRPDLGPDSLGQSILLILGKLRGFPKGFLKCLGHDQFLTWCCGNPTSVRPRTPSARLR